MAQRILVINDNQELLEIFRLILEEEGGYEVTLFSFAPQELHEIERIQPDLVIIDFLFGSEYLGWQLVQKMRMYKPTAAVPIIICTAAVPEVRAIEAQLNSHGAIVVAKPFDVDELLAAVQRALTSMSERLEQKVQSAQVLLTSLNSSTPKETTERLKSRTSSAKKTASEAPSTRRRRSVTSTSSQRTRQGAKKIS